MDEQVRALFHEAGDAHQEAAILHSVAGAHLRKSDLEQVKLLEGMQTEVQQLNEAQTEVRQLKQALAKAEAAKAKAEARANALQHQLELKQLQKPLQLRVAGEDCVVVRSLEEFRNLCQQEQWDRCHLTRMRRMLAAGSSSRQGPVVIAKSATVRRLWSVPQEYAERALAGATHVSGPCAAAGEFKAHPAKKGYEIKAHCRPSAGAHPTKVAKAHSSNYQYAHAACRPKKRWPCR